MGFKALGRGRFGHTLGPLGSRAFGVSVRTTSMGWTLDRLGQGAHRKLDRRRRLSARVAPASPEAGDDCHVSTSVVSSSHRICVLKVFLECCSICDTIYDIL